jgi:hypothetical protein
MKTRTQYMNKEISHFDYYSQFVSEETKQYVLRDLTAEQIQKALDNGDEHLNKIKIPFNNMGQGGGWWWDDAPINQKLVRELGDSLSRSTFTCVSKAAAQIIAKSK